MRIAPDKFNICDGTSKEALQTAQLFRTTLQGANVSLELLEKCGVATKVGTYRDEDENFTPSDTMGSFREEPEMVDYPNYTIDMKKLKAIANEIAK